MDQVYCLVAYQLQHGPFTIVRSPTRLRASSSYWCLIAPVTTSIRRCRSHDYGSHVDNGKNMYISTWRVGFCVLRQELARRGPGGPHAQDGHTLPFQRDVWRASCDCVGVEPRLVPTTQPYGLRGQCADHRVSNKCVSANPQHMSYKTVNLITGSFIPHVRPRQSLGEAERTVRQ